MFKDSHLSRSLWDVISYLDLVASLPEQFRRDEVLEQVKFWYHTEVLNIVGYVVSLGEVAKPFYAHFGSFIVREGCSQIIAEFFVNDLSKPKVGKYNWHGQNTSQWVYAGALVVDKHAIERGDERTVSTHH